MFRRKSRRWRCDQRHGFLSLEKVPNRRGSHPERRKPAMIPTVKAKLLEGKRGLIVGIANENSIAWGCAKAFRAFGGGLAVTYLNDKAKKYVEPLARRTGSADRDAARRPRARPDGSGVRTYCRGLGLTTSSCTRSRSRRRRRCRGASSTCRRRLPHHHGRVMLDLHPHGPSRRAADEERVARSSP